MKKKKLLPLSMAVVLSLSTLLSGCNTLTTLTENLTATSETSETGSETTVTENPDTPEVPDGNWEKPSETETVTETADVKMDEFITYNDKVLFRVYKEPSMSNIGLWGDFTCNSYPYYHNALYTYDPLSGSGKAELLCEDDGFGDMFLVGDTLYSNATKEDDTPEVTRRKLPDGNLEVICPGMLNSVSPDGKTYITANYLAAYSDYDNTGKKLESYYTIRKTDDDSYEAGLSFPGTNTYATYLGMDNSHAWFLKSIDDSHVFRVYQVDFTGKSTALADIEYEDGYYPTFEDEFEIEDGKIVFNVNFYEGTGNFYSGSAKNTVETDPSDSGSETALFKATVEYIHSDDPNEEPEVKKYPDAVKAYETSSNQDGLGFAKRLQYYTEFPDGYYFALCDCQRQPLEDIGWRYAYCYLNTHFFYLPKGATDAKEIATAYPPMGSLGKIDEVDYPDVTPTMIVFARIIGTPGKSADVLLYETANVNGPEAPIDYSEVYFSAEISDDLIYEHTVNGDIYQWALGNKDDFIKDYAFGEIYQDSLPDQSDYEGYSYEDGFDFENSASIHIGFDADGKINYIRPVIWD